MPSGIITGRPGAVKPYFATEVNVLDIEYCNLRFICNLVLEIWDFIFIYDLTSVTDLEYILPIS
jgi:hypothetical protein